MVPKKFQIEVTPEDERINGDEIDTVNGVKEN